MDAVIARSRPACHVSSMPTTCSYLDANLPQAWVINTGHEQTLGNLVAFGIVLCLSAVCVTLLDTLENFLDVVLLPADGAVETAVVSLVGDAIIGTSLLDELPHCCRLAGLTTTCRSSHHPRSCHPRPPLPRHRRPRPRHRGNGLSFYDGGTYDAMFVSFELGHGALVVTLLLC